MWHINRFFFFFINNLFWWLHCFYLLHQKITSTPHHHPPRRITEKHHLGSQQLPSRRPQEVAAGGVSQAHHWSSDAGPAARQSAALSKTRAGLKGLTPALFSPRGVESDGKCTWSVILPKTDVCRSAENISVHQYDFTDVLQSKRIQHFRTSLQLQILEDQSSS